MPEAAALVVGARLALWLSADGEVEELGFDAAAARVQSTPALVCHGRATARRLNIPPFKAFDLLELFAFVHPAQFCLPTPGGLADALGLERPVALTERAATLFLAAERLLATLTGPVHGRPVAAQIAFRMGQAGWSWGPAVLAALGDMAGAPGVHGGMDIWNRLPSWQDSAPEPPPGDASVGDEEARQRLFELLGGGTERRPQQSDYAALAAKAFAPRDQAGTPNLVLAEAGTGVGKTLGYIAPASLWAEKNDGPVWIATYTKNLQRQVDQELDRLFPDAETKFKRAVVRKGRENYLCLLNFEDAARIATARPTEAVAVGLMARWAEASRDGDMVGGDFPAWLTELFGPARTIGLSDHRGECIYSACTHYRKCYIENVIRRARKADIVVANHALVMVQAALGAEEGLAPLRYVFDEGHQLFDAADSAFSANLSGSETVELRRWLMGSEGGRRSSRARGLEARIGDLVAGDADSEPLLNEALLAAGCLPTEGWLRRITDGQGVGAAERFLAMARQHVTARAADETSPYSLEAAATELQEPLLGAAAQLEQALADLQRPLARLMQKLTARLDDEADSLETATRVRIEAACRGMRRRGEVTLSAWRAMLRELETGTPEAFVDWFSLNRIQGRDSDVGMHRHWVDPTLPFAEAVLSRAHGALITSATLRDAPKDAPDDWQAAEVRTGALHLPLPAVRASLPSPFDYGAQTRIFIVTDVRRDNADQVAAAYRELFKAAGGGGLGLFTAIQRLRGVHRRIAGPLDDAGIPLLAQHVDAMDTGTLVDIFRAEEDSCLLGTDAVRDGIDVPGRSLRLIVFDRVPWPRPDILHRARKAAFGGSAYDDMLTRLRLKQAYGRLIRKADDRGVFVLLDAMTPSRLTTGFPDDVTIARVGLAEAVAGVNEFLNDT